MGGKARVVSAEALVRPNRWLATAVFKKILSVGKNFNGEEGILESQLWTASKWWCAGAGERMLPSGCKRCSDGDAYIHLSGPCVIKRLLHIATSSTRLSKSG